MMKLFENQTFSGIFDQDSGRVFSDMRFRRCRFVHCGIALTSDPMLRSIVRNVEILKCECNLGGGWGSPVVEDCIVEHLKTGGYLATRGAVFKHVTIKGRIGALMLHNAASSFDEPAVRAAFRAANAAYYQTVDWALDISGGRFSSLDIRGIPADLIRRDPETQVIVRRSLLGACPDWNKLDVGRSDWVLTAIEFMLDDQYDDVVLVARTAHRAKAHADLAAFAVLRRAGIAE